MHIAIEAPITIYHTDIINALDAFRTHQISLNELIDWVNTVWFTDLYEFEDAHSDSIASVLDKLEELDEGDRELSETDIEKYIEALLKNTEI